MNSQQKEQLEQFRTDAPRNRAAAERIDKRAREAGEVYDEEFNKRRYGRNKSEEEYIAEAIRDTIASRRENSSDAVGDLSRAALRTGNKEAIPDIVNAAKSRSSGQLTLSEAIANAKRQGKQQYLAEKSATDQIEFNELNQLRTIADQIAGGQMNWANENNALSNSAQQALANLIATNQSGSNSISNAMSKVADSAGNVVDLSAIFEGLQGMNDNKAKDDEVAKAAFKGNTGAF